MSFKTTAVLLGLVAALVVAWQVLVSDDVAHGENARSAFFPGLMAADVQRLHLEDGSGEILPASVLLERTGKDPWVLKTSSLDEGRPVRARTETVMSLLDALRELVPLRRLEEPADEVALGRLGFGETQRVRLTVERTGGAPPLVLEIGADLGTGEITARRGGAGAVYTIPSEAKPVLVPKLEELEDPALVPVRPLDVDRLRIERGGAKDVLALERRFSKWWLVEPVHDPADQRRCDELRNHLVGLRILGRQHSKEAHALVPDPPVFRVWIHERGRQEPKVLDFGRPVEGGVPVRVRGGATVNLVGRGILNLLQQEPLSFRDRHVVTFLRSEIAEITIEGPGARKLEMKRLGPSLAVHFPPSEGKLVPPRILDAVKQGLFLEKLAALELTRYEETEPAFEPELTVTLVRAGAAQEGAESQQTFRIGPVGPAGERPIALLGRLGTGFVRADDVAFLEAPYYELIELLARGTDAYFKLARIHLEDDRGRSVTVTNTIGADDNLKGVVGEGPARRDVPPELLLPVSRMLVGLTVIEFLGTEVRPEMGFDRPQLRVRFLEAENATPKSIPPDARGVERELVIGARRADGAYYGRIDDALGLVFLTDRQGLNPFYALLDWAAK